MDDEAKSRNEAKIKWRTNTIGKEKSIERNDCLIANKSAISSEAIIDKIHAKRIC